MPLDESVLCIPTARFRSIVPGDGFTPLSDEQRLAILTQAYFQFIPRIQCETDTNFVQLIPYVVLQCDEFVFSYRRGAAGTEKRLGGLYSIGLGGHICAEDDLGDHPYHKGLERELAEEITCPGAYWDKCLGCIYDPRTLVGQVHVGLVHVWDCSLTKAQAHDASITEGQWTPITEVRDQRARYETWSQIILDQLPAVL